MLLINLKFYINLIYLTGILDWVLLLNNLKLTLFRKKLIDPIAEDVTGKGNRNLSGTIGSLRYGNERGLLRRKKRYLKILEEFQLGIFKLTDLKLS